MLTTHINQQRKMSILSMNRKLRCELAHNARLRGWQRMPLNSNTTTATTAAHWDWKRHALTVPLEALVRHFGEDTGLMRYEREQTQYLLVTSLYLYPQIHE